MYQKCFNVVMRWKSGCVANRSVLHCLNFHDLTFGQQGIYIVKEWCWKVHLLFCARFPPSKHPVLAFRGAPASFPVEEQNRQPHAFLKWSEKINKEVDEYIHNTLPRGPFIGIHLRNGIDWVWATVFFFNHIFAFSLVKISILKLKEKTNF